MNPDVFLLAAEKIEAGITNYACVAIVVACTDLGEGPSAYQTYFAEFMGVKTVWYAYPGGPPHWKLEEYKEHWPRHENEARIIALLLCYWEAL